MKASSKSKLALLPLLACAPMAFAAEPVLLNAAEMDLVTAGTQSVFERVADVLAMAPKMQGILPVVNPLPLSADQVTAINTLIAGEWVLPAPLTVGGLLATYQLKPGDQLVLVNQQAIGGDPALSRQLIQGGSVATYQLKSGESLQVLQTSSGGPNYLYVYSNGSSTVRTSQTSF